MLLEFHKIYPFKLNSCHVVAVNCCTLFLFSMFPEYYDANMIKFLYNIVYTIIVMIVYVLYIYFFQFCIQYIFYHLSWSF